jgi:peptidoglycan-associated lipoprotein
MKCAKMAFALAVLASAPAGAQLQPRLPRISLPLPWQSQPAPVPPPTVPVSTVPQPSPQMQNDLMTKAGSDRVFFSGNDSGLTAQARATLAAQARWLIANPAARAIIEGHADDRASRAQAFAIGERRASAVRDFLVSAGIPTARLSVTSWGKERPVQPVPGYPASGVSARAVLVVVQ